MPMFNLKCNKCENKKSVFKDLKTVKNMEIECECGGVMKYHQMTTFKKTNFDTGNKMSYDVIYGKKSLRTEKQITQYISALADETGRTSPY